jgi:hypothetical protein
MSTALCSLTDLAAQINEHHRAAESAMRSGLEHAMEAGRLLISAKSQCPHGEWGSWLADNFEGSDRTARAYMQIAKRWPELEAKRQNSAVLSIDGALKMLAAPKQKQKDVSANEDCFPLRWGTLESRKRYCWYWWDVLVRQTVIGTAVGWSEKQIADYVGMPEEDVWAILAPQIPTYPKTPFDLELGNAAFWRLYTDAIKEQTSSMLAACLYTIEAHIERCQLDELAAGRVYAIREHHDRNQRKHAGARDEIGGIFETIGRGEKAKRWRLAIVLCIEDDARAALRIQPLKDPDEGAHMRFHRWNRLIEENEILERVKKEPVAEELVTA